MSTTQQIFWMRVKRVSRFDPRRAVAMLLAIGAALAQAVRFVAFARAPLAL